MNRAIHIPVEQIQIPLVHEGDLRAYGSPVIDDIFQDMTSRVDRVALPDVRASMEGGAWGDVQGRSPYESEAPSTEERRPIMSRIREKIKEHPRVVRFVGGVILASTMLGSGGGVDKGFDSFTDPTEVVQEVGAEMVAAAPGPGDELDGIPFELFPPSTQEEFSVEKAMTQEATNRVAQTMRDLDGHDVTAIEERVNNFLASNQGEYGYMLENKAKTLDTIRQAETVEDVIAITNQYLQSAYGVGFKLMTNNSKVENFSVTTAEVLKKGSVQELASDVIKSFSILPRSLVEHMSLDYLQIGDKPNSEMTIASYDRNHHVITLGPPNLVTRLYDEMARVEGSDINGESVITHELGHALANGDGDDLGMHSGYNDKEMGRDYIETLILRLMNKPSSVSTYATTSMDEGQAEIFSGALTGRRDGLAHPDEVRYFGSGANRSMLGLLIRLEREYPGIVDFIVSENGDTERSQIWVWR